MSEKDVLRVSQIWRDAEDALQDEDIDLAEDLKDEFEYEMKLLSKKDKREVIDEIESFGG